AQQCRYTQRVEEITADPEALRVTRLATLREIESIITPGEDGGESLLLNANLLPQGIGHHGMASREASRCPVSICDAHLSELLRISHWKVAQANYIEQLEDGSVGANSQSER